MKDQRVAARPLDRHHLADEYDVITRCMPRVVAAFEPCYAAVDQGRIGPPKPMRDARKTVGVRMREAARQIGLLG